MTASVPDSSFPCGQAGAAHPLEQKDLVGLLHLMAELACLRNDPRRWRLEALAAMQRMLQASAAAALVVKLRPGAAPAEPPTVVSIFELGFKCPAEHAAFLDEFNHAPFQDPLSRKVFDAIRAGEQRTVTVTRREVVDDADWYASPSVQHYRRTARVDDCLISVHRVDALGTGIDGGGAVPGAGNAKEMQMMVLLALRPWDHHPLFGARERSVLDAMHRGFEWLYRSEETLQRVTRATSLSPRLRQTLDFLLAGDTERQVAARMAISIHTVHDYVKALYVHFGVSSRGELMARWIQSGEALPAVRRGP